jgi:hypothetical protein
MCVEGIHRLLPDGESVMNGLKDGYYRAKDFCKGVKSSTEKADVEEYVLPSEGDQELENIVSSETTVVATNVP